MKEVKIDSFIIRILKFLFLVTSVVGGSFIGPTANVVKAKGIFLTSSNKSLKSNIKQTTKLEVIGSAHNQFEYTIKKRQRCSIIMLSPIFYNIKYSPNKILSAIKFNLITLNWSIDICALGGINNKNIKLINLTKSKAIGIKSLVLK